jgi:hypothetical protein
MFTSMRIGGGLRADYPLKSAAETSQQLPYTLLLSAHGSSGGAQKDLTFRIFCASRAGYRLTSLSAAAIFMSIEIQ